MIRCHVCTKEKPDGCCEFSATVQAGTIEIIWNGYVAMSADCFICKVCEGAWLHFSTRSLYVCEPCRHKELHVQILPGDNYGFARYAVGGA
jgi:hypothetical protein